MFRFWHKWLAAGFVFFVLVGCATEGQTREEGQKPTQLTISAAASLNDALQEIKKQYEKEHQIRLQFNIGGTGTMQKQIEQGAPVDLFISASKEKFDSLVEKELIDKKNAVDLLANSLVVVMPKGSPNQLASYEDLKTVDKIAIGIPESVPAGKYAKEALLSTSYWDLLQDRLIQAKDVRQVLNYVETGNVDAGFVYKTDAVVSRKAEIAFTVDPKDHSPIIYPAGIVAASENDEVAKQFFQYLQSEEAKNIFRKYGFSTVE